MLVVASLFRREREQGVNEAGWFEDLVLWSQRIVANEN